VWRFLIAGFKKSRMESATPISLTFQHQNAIVSILNFAGWVKGQYTTVFKIAYFCVAAISRVNFEKSNQPVHPARRIVFHQHLLKNGDFPTLLTAEFLIPFCLKTKKKGNQQQQEIKPYSV
jgi:hypothetical protein